jgi:hypothetical protein
MILQRSEAPMVGFDQQSIDRSIDRSNKRTNETNEEKWLFGNCKLIPPVSLVVWCFAFPLEVLSPFTDTS